MPRYRIDGKYFVTGEWPKCECGKPADYALGVRSPIFVCHDSVSVYRDAGILGKRKLLKLEPKRYRE